MSLNFGDTEMIVSKWRVERTEALLAFMRACANTADVPTTIKEAARRFLWDVGVHE